MRLSTVLTCLSSAGVVATGFLSARAGMKMNEKGVKKEDFKDLNTLKTIAPDIAPPIITGGLTIAGIIGAHRLDAKQIALITASGIGTAEMLKRYQDKIKDVVGVEKYKEIQNKVLEDVEKKAKLVSPKAKRIKDRASQIEEEEIWIIDTKSEKKWKGTISQLANAKLEFNKILSTVNCATMGDWFDIWEQEPEAFDNAIGFDEEYLVDTLGTEFWVDFIERWSVADDGLKQVSVTFDPEPVYSNYLYERFYGKDNVYECKR